MHSFNDFIGQLYTVAVDGGLPEQLPLPRGGFCSYSPDDKKLAYNRVFREFRTWKRYRGGMADDVLDLRFRDEERPTNITDNAGPATSSRCGTATRSTSSPTATPTSA